ncbi:unnamed protein product [Cuscuta epithymum]|uniref:SBP-type domain-containing protein n=1 Tax=Cuscuta epithymum TaxID=186058 RepID=A0AAV0FAE4_9ASTE|nr:unnamed protein product [Cuscuta epithymum]
MEWNAKWDWESLAELSSKACESPQKLQLTDWGIVEEEGEIVNAPFNNKNNNISGGSHVSDPGGQGSSTSSPKIGSGAKTENRKAKDASIGGSAEACIGLKLGKRTYFENHGGGGGGGGNGGKTRKPSTAGGGAGARCQVEGCHVDLSSGKEYHRKHRVCESHSKYPKVMVGGLERRFCQQCSRFHSLSEFDEKKRSCRRRLCDHNARRRKPQQDAFQFSNSTNRPSPSFYDGRQQINFMMNNVPLFDTNKTASNSTCWENNNTYASNMYTITRGCTSQPKKSSSTNKQSYLSTGIHQPSAFSFRENNVSDNVLLESKGPTEDSFTQGGKGAMFYMETSMTEKYPRALSLLSTSSWGSCEDQHNNSSISESANPTTTALHEQQTIPLHLPLTPPQYWQPEPTNGHLPDVHNLFKVPQDADFYLNSFN